MSKIQPAVQPVVPNRRSEPSPTEPNSQSRRVVSRIPGGLVALALASFALGTAEFVIAGLLPDIGHDLSVTDGAAGLLVTTYAIGLGVGALVVTTILSRWRPKPALVWLVVVFVVGNLLSALGPDFGLVLTGRVLAGVTNGAFFGIGVVVAVKLVEKSRQGQAIAIMFTGLTLANVLGVPFGTFLGEHFGWRVTFGAIATIAIASMLAILLFVPQLVAGPTRSFADLRHLINRQTLLSLGVATFGFGGMFAAFTYVAFTLTRVSGFSSAAVPWLLAIFGAGLVIGNVIGGRLADLALNATIVIALVGLLVVQVVFGLVASQPVGAAITLGLMGLFGFAAVPGYQHRVMRSAASAGAIASGANVAAVNLGNALGSWIGGIAIAAGFGYTSPIWVGAAATAIALILLTAAIRSPGGAFGRDR